MYLESCEELKSCCSACSRPRFFTAAFFGWLEGAFITEGSYKIKAWGYVFKTGASNVVTRYARPSRELCNKNWALCLHCLHCLSNTCFGAVIAQSLVLETPKGFRFKGFRPHPELWVQMETWEDGNLCGWKLRGGTLSPALISHGRASPSPSTFSHLCMSFSVSLLVSFMVRIFCDLLTPCSALFLCLEDTWS